MRYFPKKMSLVLAATVSVMLSICAFAYQNEPYDFRGIKWGTRIEKLSDMLLDLDGGDLKAYTRKRDKMMIGDTKLNSLHYIFYKDEFYCVRIEFADFSNFSKIREEFLRIHGKPEGREYYDRHYYWSGGSASITLDYDESTETGELGYKYIPIDSRVDEDEKNQILEGSMGSAEEAMSNGQ